MLPTQMEIQISGSDHKPIALDITFNKARGKCPVILYAHGFNGFKDWGNFDLIASQFVDAGFTFVKFNFSHNGTSPEHPQNFVDLEAFGENNYNRALFDLGQVITWISDLQNPYSDYIDASHIGLIGHSMGGGISIIRTSEDDRIKALITWASTSQCKTPWGSWPEAKMEQWKASGVEYYLNGRTQQHMPLHYQLYEDYISHESRLDILQAASTIRVPFLLCHGTEDTGVSVESAYDLQKSNPQAQLLLVHSDHVFGRKHPWTEATLPDAMQEVLDRNIAFFRKNLLP